MNKCRFDCAVVNTRYQSNNNDNSTTIELWTRTKCGHSLLLLVQGKKPFMEITLPGISESSEQIPSDIDERLEKLSKDPDIVEIQGPTIKWTDLGEKPVWKLIVTQPFKVPSLRKRLRSRWNMYSSDIKFADRFFLDDDLGPHLTVNCDVLYLGDKAPKNLTREFTFDQESAKQKIKLLGGSGIYPVDIIASVHIDSIEKCEPFQAPYVVFSFDLETSIVNERILCAAAVIEKLSGTGESKRFHKTIVGDEEDILKELTKMVREHDPDVITGYNIENFDLPRLEEREHLHRREKTDVEKIMWGWGRVPFELSESKSKLNKESGKYKALRNRLFPTRENRNWEITGRCVMDAWWQARMALRPRRETLRYVTELLFPENEDLKKMDVDASQIDKEWDERPDVVVEYCLKDAELPLDILNEIQAIRRKEAIASVAKTSLFVGTNGSTSQLLDSLAIRHADYRKIAVPMSNWGSGNEQITGGYVHEVEAGVHPWVAVLDFKSMYPSIMIAKNICYTTLVDSSRTNEEISDSELHVSPTGARFRSSSIRKGLVPELLEDLMFQRDTHKHEMRTAKESKDIVKHQFHDAMQYAVKILMNSFYGVFASSFYRFTHKDLGSSITAWARYNIKKIITQLDSEGYDVVYSDTDSIFVKTPMDENSDYETSKQKLVDFGIKIAERFSQDQAELEFEKGLSAFFSHGAKKRYVGRIVWPNEDMVIRGYETRRTDSFNLLTEAMLKIFEMILDGREDDAVGYAVKLIRMVKKREVDVQELVISRSCKGKVAIDGSPNFDGFYENPNGLPFCNAAVKRWKNHGLRFSPGMKVSWVVSNAKKRPMVVEPWIFEETGTKVENYDHEFYAGRLATALGRITEAFGWSSEELLSGTKQTSLWSY